MTSDPKIQILGTVFFAIAVLHTFLTKPILHFSRRFPEGSGGEALFHFFAEIEVIFGLWAALFFALCLPMAGPQVVVEYIEGLSFAEPIFVFVIMLIASTKPVMWVAQELIVFIARIVHRVFRLHELLAEVLVILLLGPLCGSLMTEPAAMTVSALLIFSLFEKPNAKLMYPLLAVLFVNISIGGALTNFAAPPILMVAGPWNWDTSFVFGHFGWKSLLAVTVNAVGFVLIFQKELRRDGLSLRLSLAHERLPLWVILLQFLFLILAVICSHHVQVLFAIFLFFLGITTVTKRYQSPLRMRESLLVAFFLGGVIAFGAFQKWWLQPLLGSLNDLALYYGSVLLTSVTDNAALTYLGTQVANISESAKYNLVAGAIAGGGLTIIANAPNPAGYSILQSKFPDGLNPIRLFLVAIPPTVVAVLFLEFLPNL